MIALTERCGDAPVVVMCPDHKTMCQRIFGDVSVGIGDPIRRAYLKSTYDNAFASQGRAEMPGTPHDSFEARDTAARTGRVYIGDDHNQLSAKGRGAIERGKGIIER